MKARPLRFLRSAMATLIFPLRQKVCVCLKMKVCVWRGRVQAYDCIPARREGGKGWKRKGQWKDTGEELKDRRLLKKKVGVRRGGMWKRRIERKDDGKWDWAGKKGAPRVYGKYLEVQGQVKWTPAPMMHCNLTERAKLLIELHFWPEL